LQNLGDSLHELSAKQLSSIILSRLDSADILRLGVVQARTRRETTPSGPEISNSSRKVGGGKFFQDNGLGNYARCCAALEVFPFVTVNPYASYRQTQFVSFQPPTAS
jgi:hypothetical protein